QGVSGCGKSTVGKGLADALHVPFIDADDLHPKSNVDKMAQGEPLTDADRMPWLHIVRDAAVRTCRVENAAGHETGVVVACSALRRSYRDLLRGIPEGEVRQSGEKETLRTFFCLVDGPREVLFERMSARKNHFMKAKMLDSQIATLEDPRSEEGVFVVKLEDSVEDQVKSAVEALAKHGVRPAESDLPTREAVGEGVPVVVDSDESIQKGSQEIEATA
ncbi:carbohydrate kinase, partial [Auricularia subglabra TFB-10046 SS5]